MFENCLELEIAAGRDTADLASSIVLKPYLIVHHSNLKKAISYRFHED